MNPTLKLGRLVVISGPSGCGKSKVIEGLLACRPKAMLSVSHTTRPMREGEVDGVHYHFIDNAKFATMIQAGEFLEWAEVHGKYYGTSRDAVLAQINQGVDVFLDIDVKGWESVLGYDFGENCPKITSVFILPPSLEVLEERLKQRPGGTNDIELRLKNAELEMSFADRYDFKVVNHTGALDTTISVVGEFLKGE